MTGNMKLILYGSGMQGKKTLEKIRAYEGLLYVDYFCDSDLKKEGTFIEGVPIISVNTLLEISRKSHVSIIICSMYREEIIENLRNNGILDNCSEVYISVGESANILPLNSLYQPLSPLFDIRNVNARLFNRLNFNSVKYEPVTFAGTSFKISIEPYNKEGLRLLEHQYDRIERKPTKTVIATSEGKCLNVSNDMCNTFTEYQINLLPSEYIQRCFTTIDGYHIIMTCEISAAANSKRVIILDDNFNETMTYAFSDTRWPWHGTFSIDQNARGTIIYAEYPCSADYREVSVYRSTDNGFSWNRVFSLPASIDMSYGDVRHFHTCMADPYISGRWYITAGDKGDACGSFWISSDDGITWEKTKHGEIRFLSIGLNDSDKKGIKNQLYRMTTAIITEDSIYYINDSNYQDQNPQTLCIPCFMRAEKRTPYGIDVISKVGVSSIRSMVRINSDIFIAFSENKNFQGKVDIFIGSLKNGEIKYVGGIPSEQGSPGTLSISSIAAADGVFAINMSRCFGEGYAMAVVKCRY